MTRGPLHIDFETRSAVDLKKAGMYRYAEDPTTEIILASYRFGDEPVKRWRGAIPPDEVTGHIALGGKMIGHNQGFERVIWNAKIAPLTRVYLAPDQQDCTMSRASAMGLPASLDNLGSALKLGFQKDKQGHALMLRMCKPKTLEPLTWHEAPDELDRLAAYCDRDVETECDADAHLPALSERERRVWELDQRINDRGVAIDVPRVRAALDAVEVAKKAADREMWRLTNGAVKKTTEAKKLVDWLTAQGIECESIADGEIDDIILKSQMLAHPNAEAAVRLRRASAGAFKFQAMLAQACRDGRVRGSLSYHATMGGRWAGRGMQPQNFKRMDTDEEVAWAAQAVDLLGDPRISAADVLTAIEMFTGQPALEVLSLCARPMLVAAPGKKLIDADFSNIEGRINAWLAGEDWKLQAFRDYDAGVGPDLYKVTASRVLGKPVEEITKAERQNQGKVPELACGYQGGVHAFQKMGAKYGVSIPDSHALQIVRGYREANPMIVQSWYDLQNAALEAVGAPGCVVSVLRDKIRYFCNGDFLFCQLPSGRVISYASPRIEWKTRNITVDGENIELNGYGISYWGSKNGRLLKLDLYGGAQCAHVVSGTARDLLVEAMFAVEDEGYELVLTVHDELLAEVGHNFGSAAHFESIIQKKRPAWIGDMPMVSKAWEDVLYVK